MQLAPTNEKVTIKWFAVLSDRSKMRNTKGFISRAWEASCSCGWETKSGGAIKASIQRDVEAHKIIEHNYSWRVN